MARSALLVLFICLTCVGCDQYTKSLAKEDLQPGESVTYLGGFLKLQYEVNRGGMLSVGAEFPESLRFWVFTVAVGLFLAVIFAVVCVHRTLSLGDRLAAALIVGGGFGNFIDRLMYDGHVIDFLNIGLGPVRTAIFNVADVAVLSGAALLLTLQLRKRAART